LRLIIPELKLWLTVWLIARSWMHFFPAKFSFQDLTVLSTLVLPKSEEDFAKNLKVLDDLLHKLKLRKNIDYKKLARAKFPDNMELVKWLYQFYNENVNRESGEYLAYEKRVEAVKKQKRVTSDHFNVENYMSAHLIPNQSNFNTAYLRMKPERTPPQSQDLHQQRLVQLRDLVLSLEQELTNQVSNYKVMQEELVQVEEERNFYFHKLRQIEHICNQTQESEMAMALKEIISETPEEFLPVPSSITH
jgi:RP/EB family microtubule-associated protein